MPVLYLAGEAGGAVATHRQRRAARQAAEAAAEGGGGGAGQEGSAGPREACGWGHGGLGGDGLGCGRSEAS